jgi:uncharacterized protein
VVLSLPSVTGHPQPMDWALLLSITFILLAAIVRGFSGFGFSLLAITSLSLLAPPADVIPSILMLEIIASLRLLPEVWKDVHWRSLLPLLLGCLVATPLGVWILATIPAPPMQMAIGLFTLGAVFLLWRGHAMKSMPGPAATTAIGAASGFANGAFGIGGPPVILFYFSSPTGHAAGRASLIAYFFATDAIALAFLWQEDLVTKAAAWKTLAFLPALLVGVWIGAHAFKRMDQARFRNAVLMIMGLLGALSILKGLSLI